MYLKVKIDNDNWNRIQELHCNTRKFLHTGKILKKTYMRLDISS